MVAREIDEDEEQREAIVSQRIKSRTQQSQIDSLVGASSAERLWIFDQRTRGIFYDVQRGEMGSPSHRTPSLYCI